MSVFTVEHLKARCTIDPLTGCWIWTGGCNGCGTPRIHTIDFARMEKRSMSGPQGAWNIAHQKAPLPGWLVYRTCGCTKCLNPVHLREVRSRKEMGQYVRWSGRMVGTAMEARRANQLIAMAAAGITPTAPQIVFAIRRAPPTVTAVSLAAKYGMSHQTVTRIRRGESHRQLVEAE